MRGFQIKFNFQFGNWNLEIGNWKYPISNFQILEIGNWIFSISNFQIPISKLEIEFNLEPSHASLTINLNCKLHKRPARVRKMGWFAPCWQLLSVISSILVLTDGLSAPIVLPTIFKVSFFFVSEGQRVSGRPSGSFFPIFPNPFFLKLSLLRNLQFSTKKISFLIQIKSS